MQGPWPTQLTRGVGWCYTLLLGYETHDWYGMVGKSSLRPQPLFIIVIDVDMNILFLIQAKNVMLIKRSCRCSSPSSLCQLCWLLSLEWLSYFGHAVQSLFNSCCFDICSWSYMQLKYRCSNKERNWIMVVYVKMNKCTIVIHSVGLGSMECPGRVLCIIRENPSVLKSNHLHVVISFTLG